MIGREIRISKPGDEFGAEDVAPAGSVEFPEFGDLGFFVRDEVERRVVADAKVFRPVSRWCPNGAYDVAEVPGG